MPQELGLNLDVPEPHLTYAENATAKAVAYCTASGLPALADDSGIEVSALDWGPGARSARHGGSAVDDRAALILEMLGEAPDRRARMVCWLALVVPRVAPDGTPRSPRIELFSGVMDGMIARRQRGTSGFGYDPIFEPASEPPGGRTLGLWSAAEKHRISHRARAARRMAARLAALGLGPDPD